MSQQANNLDFGKLLRLQNMVTAAAETEPTMDAAVALVGA
jgi:hypothetical protein